MARQAVTGIQARPRQYPGGRKFVVTPELSRGKSIPAPVEGWDAITPIANMPETRAVTLDNMFPQPGYVEVRTGHKTHNRVTGTPAIESVMAYHALSSANDKLLAAGGTAIWDVTTAVSATVSTTVLGGLTNARLNHFNVAT